MKLTINVVLFFALLYGCGVHGNAQSRHLTTIRLKPTDTTTLIIERGDITQSPVAAIVNAANPQLAAGSGVCGAIFKAAGKKFLENACHQYPTVNGIKCPTGHAKITMSGDLKKVGIEYIIHAVGPDCRIIKDERQQDKFLAQAYGNTLQLADNYAVSSIAFPFISSAIYAFPKERAATIALYTIINYLKKHQASKITNVRMVLFSNEDLALFNKIAHQIKF